MANLVLRLIKGSGLTDQEMDSNFTNLNNELFLTTANSKPWIANSVVKKGEILSNNSRFYLVNSDGTTGASAPSHTSGSSSNGTTTLQVTEPVHFSPYNILTHLKTVDGSGSGLDADVLDGLNPSSTLPTVTNKSSIVSRDSSGNSTFNNITLTTLNSVNISSYVTTSSSPSFTNITVTGNSSFGDAVTDSTTIRGMIRVNNSVGASGQFLTSGGLNADCTWVTLSVGDMFKSENLFGLNPAVARQNINASSLGTNTYTGYQYVPDEIYDINSWENNLSVPTKNAVRDKIVDLESKITDLNSIIRIENDIQVQLTSTAFGSIVYSTTANGEVILPQVQTSFINKRIHFTVVTGTLNIIRQGASEKIYANGKIDQNNIRLVVGQSLTLYYDGTNWVQMGFTPDDSIGVNQTWQNVTSSRASNIVYTNTTGKPIMVSIYRSSATSSGTLFVGNVSASIVNPSSDSGGSVCAIIPNNATYYFNAAFSNWTELR